MKGNQINQFVTDQIRRLRLEQGMRVQEIAHKAGIPLGSYSCLETGRYRLNMENLFRILQVLDAPITDVWPETGDVAKPEEGINEGYIVSCVASARSKIPGPVSVHDIIGIICAEYGVTAEELADPSRERPRAEARTMAAMLVRDEGHLTQTRLSREFKRDVSSLSHSLRSFNERLATDKKLASKVKRVRGRLERLKSARLEGHALKDVRREYGD